MYRFKTGQFEGMILEQVMLRNAPDLYRLADWAECKTILQDTGPSSLRQSRSGNNDRAGDLGPQQHSGQWLCDSYRNRE
jgi:hypothetical protein